ncbi:hypothetical protein Nans01_11060 [Nocardiopsis ansamitocini]|uniref:Uncharacterized protein n=1 Tax=Nocardiopsis ansamitocini TaxID=1670832 RepID=A0A9W6P3W5_9ACTN|nr:hypothetical protein Nans01_11060 [Nocardiopsis ansamitocini]
MNTLINQFGSFTDAWGSVGGKRTGMSYVLGNPAGSSEPGGPASLSRHRRSGAQIAETQHLDGAVGKKCPRSSPV